MSFKWIFFNLKIIPNNSSTKNTKVKYALYLSQEPEIRIFPLTSSELTLFECPIRTLKGVESESWVGSNPYIRLSEPPLNIKPKKNEWFITLWKVRCWFFISNRVYIIWMVCECFAICDFVFRIGGFLNNWRYFYWFISWAWYDTEFTDRIDIRCSNIWYDRYGFNLNI